MDHGDSGEGPVSRTVESAFTKVYGEDAVTALIALKVETSEADTVASEVSRFPEVQDVFLVTGDTDIFLKVRFPQYRRAQGVRPAKAPRRARDPGIEDPARRDRLQGRRGGPSGMSGELPLASAPVGAAPPARGPAQDLEPMLASLGELAEDLSVPKNVRRGALAAKAELERRGRAADVRIASAVYALDELANDPNLPTHGRTAIWSLISRLESLQ